MSPEATYWLQQALNALQLGSIYALIALGYSMVYGILSMINFAHGDVFMVGAFLCFLAGTALGLPFTVIHAGTDAAMFAELDSAYQRKGPIMLWIYSPHWAPAKYEGEWVQFPEYTPECYTDPKWGSNPDMAYDCGKPHGEIWKYAWSGMKDKWPVAYKVAKNYQIDAARLTAKGLGQTKPVAPNDTPEGRQNNRRVELAKTP